MHTCFEPHKDEITFVINTFPKFINLREKHITINCVKMCFKTNFTNFKCFFFFNQQY